MASETTETLQRVRRIETRLTQLLIAQGIDTAKQKPAFLPSGEDGPAEVSLPSPHTSVKELLAAIPTGFAGPVDIFIGEEPIGQLVVSRAA